MAKTKGPLYIEQSLKEKIAGYAKKEDRSFNNMLVGIIKKGLRLYEKERNKCINNEDI